MDSRRFAIKWFDPIDGSPSWSASRFDTAQQAYDRACQSTLEHGYDGHFEIWNMATKQKAEVPNEHGERF